MKKYNHLLLTLIFMVSASLAYGTTIYYVDQENGADGHNGKSWNHALKTLQKALHKIGNNNSCDHYQVWVAKGTYYPDDGPANNNNRFQTFELRNNTEVYGGFSGNENSLSQRNVQNNVTILNGDIQQNGKSEDYAYTIVSSYNLNVNYPSTLDGFTIKNSSNAGDSYDHYGGGVSISSSTPHTTISNCKFMNNKATYGGGVYTSSNGVSFNNCYFAGNKSTTSSMNPSGSVAYHNTSYNDDGSTTHVVEYTNCTFDNNYSGIWSNGYYTVNITDCSFTNTIISPAVYCKSTVNIANSLFKNNYGDAINVGESSISGISPSCTMNNCLVTKNQGISIRSYAGHLTLNNCTVAHNYKDIQVVSGCHTTFNNTVIWNIDDTWTINNQDYTTEPDVLEGTIVANYSLIQDQNYGGTNLDGTDDSNSPRFITGTSILANDSVDLHLQLNSPLINRGDPNGSYSSTDVAGQTRVNLDTIDIGAYEYQGSFYYDSHGYSGSGVDMRGQDFSNQDLASMYPSDYFSNVNLRGANLIGADLTGMDLSGTNLYGASISSSSNPTILSNTNLNGACILNTTIAGASMDNANLLYVDFKNLDIQSVDFNNSTFAVSSFVGASMNNVNMRNTSLTAVDFSGIDMTTVDLSYVTIHQAAAPANARTKFNNAQLNFQQFRIDRWPNSYWPITDLTHTTINGLNANNCSFRDKNLSYAKLTGFDFHDFDFYNATLDYAILDTTILSNANLDNVNFRHGSLVGVVARNLNFNDGDLSHTQLQGADLSYASMANTNFQYTNLESFSNSLNSFPTSLSNASLPSANFQNASLDGVDFTSAHLEGADFQALTIYDAKFPGAHLSNANFSNTELYGIDFSNTTMQNVSFEAAEIQESTNSGFTLFHCSQLGGANFTSAEVSSTNFQNAIMIPADSCCVVGNETVCGTIQYNNSPYGPTTFPASTSSVICPNLNSPRGSCSGDDWVVPNWSTNGDCSGYDPPVMWTKPDCNEPTDPSGGNYVTFTDPNLETCIINRYFNGNTGQEVSVAWAEVQTNLDISNCSVTDLGGLESFTDLLTLEASNNEISTPQNTTLRQLTQLQELSIDHNQLPSIDLNNSNLNTLDVSSNQLTNLTLSATVQLSALYAADNQLTTLSLDSQPLLTIVNLSSNRLSSIGSISGLYLLRELNVNDNDLTTIGDISQICNPSCGGSGNFTQLDIFCNPNFCCTTLFPTPSSGIINACRNSTFITPCNHNHSDCNASNY